MKTIIMISTLNYMLFLGMEKEVRKIIAQSEMKKTKKGIEYFIKKPRITN